MLTVISLSSILIIPYEVWEICWFCLNLNYPNSTVFAKYGVDRQSRESCPNSTCRDSTTSSVFQIFVPKTHQFSMKLWTPYFFFLKKMLFFYSSFRFREFESHRQESCSSIGSGNQWFANLAFCAISVISAKNIQILRSESRSTMKITSGNRFSPPTSSLQILTILTILSFSN